MNKKPSHYNSKLKDSYILEIAKFIKIVRGEVIDRHDPDFGDTPMVLGIRCYECARTRLIQQESAWDWFKIITYSQRFTFSIFGVPVRFSRNDPDSLPSKKLIRSEQSQSLVNQKDWIVQNDPHSTLHWFIVIDTAFDRAADTIYFVGYSENNDIVCKWEIDLEGGVTLLASVNDELPQAKDIASAPLGLKKKIRSTNNDE